MTLSCSVSAPVRKSLFPACVLAGLLGSTLAHFASAQVADQLPAPDEVRRLEAPSPMLQMKEKSLIDEVLVPELIFRIDPSQSKIIRTKLPITRVAITDPVFVEVNEFGPTELEVIGLKSGQTTMTFWFTHPDGTESILRYLVLVAADETEQKRTETEYGKLQTRINEMFPNSHVQLIPIADKLIVRGQARDSKEAAEILALLGSQSVDQSGNLQGGGGNLVNLGSALRLPGLDDLQTSSIISMLEVPGEQQVMLKVRIAELTRSAARDLGLNFIVAEDKFTISNFLGSGSNISAILDAGDISLFIKAFSTNGYGKILAEPTLVTLSGQTANFIAGGQFAVPTAVGVQGVGAVATTFQGFGTQLAFTPTVIDKDKIRLQVAPTFSSVSNANRVKGIPGLNTRSVRTTVDLREGQWLAIAGLIQDEQGGSRQRIPFLGDIPVIGAAFGTQNVKRDETELVVLVSPELVHPLEHEQVPLLPGMGVTEPTDGAFYGLQHIEGNPNVQHRSTVWPIYQQAIRQQNCEMRQGSRPGYRNDCQVQQSYYMSGPIGFSD